MLIRRLRRQFTRLFLVYPLVFYIIESEMKNDSDNYLRGNRAIFNLALEEELLHTEHTGTWLYLWQNKDTVVVGRNQNPYRECNIEYLHQNNICAVRRLSGGGAVFHDMGNLNYTFLSRDTEYDVQKQNSVIIEAIKRLGINAYCSGRMIFSSMEKVFWPGILFREWLYIPAWNDHG